MADKKLNNRVMMSNPSCYTCKQCVYGQRDPRSALPEVGLCMLGLTDNAKIQVQQSLDAMDDFAVIVPSEMMKFLELPEDKTRRLTNSPRYVTGNQACQYYRQKDQLDERKLICVKACPTCNHSLGITAWDNEEEDDVLNYFCLIGLPREDRRFVTETIESYGFQTEEGDSYPHHFLELMQLDADCTDVLMSQRLVNANLCCQFYKGAYSEEEQ